MNPKDVPFNTDNQGGERERAQIPEAERWDLSHLYPDDASWRRAKDALVSRIPEISSFRGTLSASADRLLACLTLTDELSKEYLRLTAYAGMHSDEDTRDARYLGMQAEIGQVGSTLSSAASFIEPEILAAGADSIAGFLAAGKGLSIYRHYLDDLRRREAHTGTPGEERIIAEAGLMADGPGDIYSVFTNADFPYPRVTVSGGESVTLTPSAFAIHRASAVREDRKNAFKAYFSCLNGYRRTFGTQLYAQVRKDIFFARARKHASSLSAALHANNIPEDVYRSLISGIRGNLGILHRYLRLRKRMLGIDSLHYHDLYAPLVKELDRRYSLDEARELILASLAPLGSDYVEVAGRVFSQRWMDVYPTKGKRSGAYSNGIAYDVHPYILLNYNGRYDDVSTVTHELGHTMHSHLSNTGQPYATSHYSIFVAEVASTLNENLLFDHILRTLSDRNEKLAHLGHYLEHFKATVFRQTQFAEFELLIHEMAEAGEALTGDTLNARYLDITRAYYGHDQGICSVDEYIGAEWAYIPHFYYNFYVFQYATSFCASSAIAGKILGGDREATEKYLGLLSAGGSDYPIELLKKAGVDMTTPGPVAAALGKMERVMDEMEKLLGE